MPINNHTNNSFPLLYSLMREGHQHLSLHYQKAKAYQPCKQLILGGCIHYRCTRNRPGHSVNQNILVRLFGFFETSVFEEWEPKLAV